MYKRSEIKPFDQKVWLASPTMHGLEMQYIQKAYETNWMSTVGENIKELEKNIATFAGCSYVVALSCGTAALHMAIRAAGEAIYGKPEPGKGSLSGKKVFCSDMTFAATVNPIIYENGEPVFIDSEYDTWNMDPKALEKAFEEYPDTKIVVLVHLYGTPAKLDEIRAVADAHEAVIIEDAAESFGAAYKGRQTGTFGDYSVISFNGNKIITGSSGGAFLTDCKETADQIKKWSTQSREPANWYQHEEIGFNYRMSNVIAGIVRGQLPYLNLHIQQKKDIYERYREGFQDLPVRMNPLNMDECAPNYWLSCMIIDEAVMCEQSRADLDVTYVPEEGKTCPAEILEALSSINAEGRPIWKPMHMQPVFSHTDFITAGRKNASDDIFQRGLCLPSDNKMTVEEQNRIIEVVRRCFE